MRKYEIDNVRWIAVLFLFPYHTARIFDSIHPFYIKGAPSELATAFVLGCTPWFMPLLFAVAGISTRYALEKRSAGEYVRERFSKLFVPLLAGLLLLIPIQTFIAERFHNAYTGTYLEQYVLFFTKTTDFTGYEGGFTPGQLWFVFYLFLLSLAALPLICVIRRKDCRWRGPHILILPLCLITWPLSYVWDVGGKSMGEYFSLFILGYYVLAEESVQEFTDRRRIPLSVAGGALTAYTVVFQTSLGGGGADRGIMIAASWLCILAILGMGRHFLNFQNRWMNALSAASFPLYLFHQSWIVLIGYAVLQSGLPAGVQFFMILAGGFLGAVLTYEGCRRFRLLRMLFAIKDARANQNKMPQKRR